MGDTILIGTTEPAEQYLKTFHWNKVKYRADKPLGEIVDTLQKVVTSKAQVGIAMISYAMSRRSLVSITMSKINTTNTTKSKHPSQRYKESKREAF